MRTVVINAVDVVAVIIFIALHRKRTRAREREREIEREIYTRVSRVYAHA